MTVSDDKIQVEGLGDNSKSLGESCVKAGEKLAMKILYNPARVIDVTANIATAAASRNTKAALSKAYLK